MGSWCPGGMAVDCRCCRVLLPQLSPVVVDDICRVDGVVRICAHPRARAARCVRCGRVSRRVHSTYRRHLADLPVAGQQTVLRLRVVNRQINWFWLKFREAGGWWIAAKIDIWSGDERSRTLVAG